MKITLRYAGEERELDVPEGATVAEAARTEGIRLFGSCFGHNACAQCSIRVRTGMEKLLTKDGSRYEHPEGYAEFVRTCQVGVAEEGVSLDADDRARRW